MPSFDRALDSGGIPVPTDAHSALDAAFDKRAEASLRSSYTHPKCGKRITQRGNRTGHCAKCCETFEGLALFDLHQKLLPSGQVECLHPSILKYAGAPLSLVDGSWRGRNAFVERRGWEGRDD
jgi:hypothetical protein